MQPTLAELLTTVLVAVGGGGLIVAALVGWLGKVWADRIAHALRVGGEIDLDLRKRRIEAYAALWRMTGRLPSTRDPGVDHLALEQLGHDLRAWYYDVGGFLLSRDAHDRGYGPLQGTIATVLRDREDESLKTSEYDAVRKRLSALRACLTEDIASRRGPRRAHGLLPEIDAG